MDESDDELASILSGCQDANELNRRIMRHATIVQHLVCRMARNVHQSETGIRTLYAAWADLAVERLHDPRVFPTKRPH